MRTQVRPLASLGRLRIRRCHEQWRRLQPRLGYRVAVAVVCSYSSNSTPSLGTSMCCGCDRKKKKKKKKKKRNKKQGKQTKKTTLFRFIRVRITGGCGKSEQERVWQPWPGELRTAGEAPSPPGFEGEASRKLRWGFWREAGKVTFLNSAPVLFWERQAGPQGNTSPKPRPIREGP